MTEEENMTENMTYDELLQLWYEEQDQYINEILDSTPETRKDWSTDDWVQALYWNPGFIDAEDCPINEFSPEEWAEIVVNGDGFEPQYCPIPEKVIPLLSKNDFKDRDSQYVYVVQISCDWLDQFLPDVPPYNPDDEE